MNETALGEALYKTPGDLVAKSRLYNLALECLRRNGMSHFRALDAFVATLIKEGGALAVLMKEKQIRAEASLYLSGVVKDANGSHVGAKAPAGVGEAKHSVKLAQKSHMISRFASSNPRRGPSKFTEMRRVATPSFWDRPFALANKSLGQIRYSELPRLASLGDRSARAARALMDLGQPLEPNARLSEYLAEKDVRRILEEAGL